MSEDNSIQKLKLERKVLNHLAHLISKNDTTLNVQINESLAKAFNIMSHTETLEAVYNQFNLFISSIPHNIALQRVYDTTNNKLVDLTSVPFTYRNGDVQKECFFRVTLTDNVVAAYLRFPSRDKLLRQQLRSLIHLNSLNISDVIELQEGAKHTALGYNSRTHSEIDQVTPMFLYGILTDIYRLVSPYI